MVKDFPSPSNHRHNTHQHASKCSPSARHPLPLQAIHHRHPQPSPSKGQRYRQLTNPSSDPRSWRAQPFLLIFSNPGPSMANTRSSTMFVSLSFCIRCLFNSFNANLEADTFFSSFPTFAGVRCRRCVSSRNLDPTGQRTCFKLTFDCSNWNSGAGGAGLRGSFFSFLFFFLLPFLLAFFTPTHSASSLYPAAFGLAEAGLNTACITKLFPTRSHTVAAQVSALSRPMLASWFLTFLFTCREVSTLPWEI